MRRGKTRAEVWYFHRCEVCGKRFRCARAHARFDSALCRKAAQRARDKTKDVVRLISKPNTASLLVKRSGGPEMAPDLVVHFLGLATCSNLHWSAYGIKVRHAAAAIRHAHV
jgi:hypothetical protein